MDNESSVVKQEESPQEVSTSVSLDDLGVPSEWTKEKEQDRKPVKVTLSNGKEMELVCLSETELQALLKVPTTVAQAKQIRNGTRHSYSF